MIKQKPMKLRIEKIGNSAVLVLPDELLGKLNLREGQWVELSELPGGGLRLTPCTADVQKTMAILDDVMVEYHDTLKKLADG
jgi:putative addiction module antidote